MKKCFVAVAMTLIFCLPASKANAMKAGSFEISPFIAVTEKYSDNVLATKDNAKSDFSTTITPGIQLIFPRVKRKFQLELKYWADIEKFSRVTSENAVSHTFEGKFGILFPLGLELHADDRFRRAHDARGVSLGPNLDFYKENVLHASAAYSLTDRFKVQLDYSNDILRYDADENKFRNFMANSFAGYVFYRFLPKTSAFVEYDYVIVEFDEFAPRNLNSTEQHIFGGITWDITGKTHGMIKAGYGSKDFDDSSNGRFRSIIAEVAIQHNFTSKHSISITGSRATHETNLQGDNFFVETALSAQYAYRLTGKITGKAGIEYVRDSYRGSIPRTDNIWRAGFGLSYQFKKWLLTEAGYSYTIRNSSLDDFNYTNNTVFIRVVGTL